MKKTELVNGQFYHIYNRGVDKREIFSEKGCYFRFIKYLYECNNISPVDLRGDLRGGLTFSDKARVLLVDIICFILIPNHFHLILRQLIENGISKFMQKLGTGYTMYFNEKNDRTGRLFESKYKSKLIETDEYFMYLSKYIHLNCIDLVEYNWKKEGIKDWDRANKFLENYKWSSYLDYIGKSNFPNIINKKPLEEYFKTPEQYKKYVQSWTQKDMDKLGDFTIE